MASRQKRARRPLAKMVLRLPELEQSRNAVLISLAAPSSRESYRHAMEEFIGWYCSEPRLSFSRTVVLRYRFFLTEEPCALDDQRSPGRCAAAYLRSLRHGLLSAELAAGVRRVKGVKRLGVRIGNWLTIKQAQKF